MRQDGFKLSSKKTAILSFSLAILITLSAVFTFNAAGALYATNKFAEGEGTVEDPYIISNLDELEYFKEYIEALDEDENGDPNHGKGKYFKLNNDIDMSSKYGSEAESWTFIGTANGFAGTLDGAGHAINNLYIDNTDGSLSQNGLFHTIAQNGTVKNLTVTGTITGSNNDSSGAITYENKGTIENCHSACKIESYNQSGGIAGINDGSIKNCWNSGKVTAISFSGGIAGQNSNSSTKTPTIENCYNIADINITSTQTQSGSGAGGIAGKNENSSLGYDFPGTIKNCYNIGNVSGSNTNVHSIVGNNGSSSSAGIVENCYYLDSTDNTPNVTATSKTADEFKSGEVAHLLQEKTGNQVWGQDLGSGNPDDYPILSAENSKKVLKVSFMYKKPPEGTSYIDYAARYTNPNGTVTLPDNTFEESEKSYVITGWSTDESGTTADFDSTKEITKDTTVYAIIKSMRFKQEYPDLVSGETRHYGDVNGDSEYNVIDAYIIRKIVDAGEDNLESIGINTDSIEYKLADIVYDPSAESVVNQDDLDFINNYIVGNITIDEG